jgi:hypothetical protein
LTSNCLRRLDFDQMTHGAGDHVLVVLEMFVVLFELARHGRQRADDVLRHAGLLGNDQCFHLITIPFLACARAHPYVGAVHAPIRIHHTKFSDRVQKARHRPVVPPPHPDPPLRRARQGGVCGAGHRRRRDPDRIHWARSSAGTRRRSRHPHDPKDPNHTFYFHVDEDRVIDALHGGNSSRWINHSCDPNCEADEVDGRIFIKALRDIAAGEELNYDYGLIIDERYTPKLKAEYPCWCGSAHCRGTLLAPSGAWRPCGNRLRQDQGRALSGMGL